MSAEPHLDLQTAIAAAWERRAELSPATKGADREAVEAALELLDSGEGPRCRPRRGRLDRASMAEAGGAALLPPQRRTW